jgi:hypothetical protein
MKLIWAYRLFRSWDNSRLDSVCKAFMFVNGENVPLTQPYQAKVIVSKHMPVQQIYSFVPPKRTIPE